MTGKDRIIKFLESKPLEVDIESLENNQTNLYILKQDDLHSFDYFRLQGCPACFGLPEFVGECFYNPNLDDVCVACWKRALK